MLQLGVTSSKEMSVQERQYLGITHFRLKLLNFMVHLCFPLETFHLMNVLGLHLHSEIFD